MNKARYLRGRPPAHLLIVGLMAVLVLAACAKVETKVQEQPSITSQPDSPTEAPTIESAKPATIPNIEPTAAPENTEAAAEEPLSPTTEARPTKEKPDEPQTPETETVQAFGITEFLREKVTEGKGVWPFVSLDDPVFITADEATHLEPLDLVLGVSINGEHKAYPTSMMWFHHVANDTVGGQPVAVTY